MSESIIIDGVNVADCVKFCKTDNYNEPNKCWSDISESYSDCKPKEYQCLFYVEQIEKQLQRLKAESEELKAKYKKQSLTVLDLKTTNDLLIQECRAEDCKQLGKYQQALEEIRENFKAFRQCTIPFHVGDKGNLPHSLADMIQMYCNKIETKINEVLADVE